MDVINNSVMITLCYHHFLFLLHPFQTQFSISQKKIPLDKTQVKTHTSSSITLQQLTFWILSSFMLNMGAKMLRAIFTLIRRKTLKYLKSCSRLSILSKINPLGQDLSKSQTSFILTEFGIVMIKHKMNVTII